MMWMMGYNDAGEFNTIQDPFTGRKLRPLMPRPVVAAAAAAAASINHPSLTRIHGAEHFLGLNHHLAMVEQNKREPTTQQVVVSSRWNPTAEQLQTLEELYRRGTRTPTAEQIQQITAQLRRYGKIEGKNVFYWFQNHKARERQKRRRQLDSLSDDQQQQPNNNNNNNNSQTGKDENREPPGGNRTAIEVEQTKNWASPTNSSTIAAEKTIQGASKCAEHTECKAADHGWVQFDDDGSEMLLQQRGNATWQMTHSSASPSSSSSPLNNSSSLISTMQKQSHLDDHFINFFDLEPCIVNHQDDEAAQTLQLFPLRSGRGLNDNDDEECGPVSDDDVMMTSAPHQFFEFL
ncbi:hypothetical protein CASFOL_015696 [Castilleja foliolosa]|uniref:Homeobox domain-containing protein n=1 Tax=Castilleja foliolosa TaxID=1961234 RepID=A0ABD3DF14_9LAMI